MNIRLLIVGSGLFGSTFAYLAAKAGWHCLVIDRQSHLGGDAYCEKKSGNVYKYGPHFFHTSDKEVWGCVNAIVPFNRDTNSPLAEYKYYDIAPVIERAMELFRAGERQEASRK